METACQIIKTKDDIGKTINTDADTPEQYAAQRFQDTAHSTATDTAYYFNKAGKKSVADTKKNIENAQVTLEDIKARRAERKAKAKAAEHTNQSIIKTAENATKKPSETALKNAPKTASNDICMGNNSVLKNKGKTIKTANDNFAKAKDIKTAKNTIATNRLAVSKTAEKSRKAAQYMRETAREVNVKAETRTETKEITSTDENGNEVITTEEVTIKVLTITVNSKTANDMANEYSFNKKQKEYLAELMNDSNDKLWASIIFSTGGNTNVDIDFDALDFGDETVNDMQRKLVAVVTNSESYGISAKSGYCQAWVADVYQAVTGSRVSAHCALCAADMWAVSQDFSKIQVGATVYGYSSNQFGHVGIYIGNGMVAHNIGEIKIERLDEWIKKYKGFAWGWENGKTLI